VVYYYTWGKVDDKTHLRIGWVYAGSAWMSLVVINGILTFMLTPGEAWLAVAGTGEEASRFWNAFFNPTYWPSLILRTLICISLAGIWAFITASRIDIYKQLALKTEVMRWSAKWLLPAFLLLPVVFLWYLYQLPAARLDLLRIGISTIGAGHLHPGHPGGAGHGHDQRPPLPRWSTSWPIATRATSPLGMRSPAVLALAVTASTEYAREMLRKPYVVANHMYSNGIRIGSVEDYNRDGYLARSPWITAAERDAWASPADGTLVPAAAPGADTLARGQMMFRGQCMACHTVDGYRTMRGLLAGRDRTSIVNILDMLHKQGDDSPYKAFMPPLVGTMDERAALADYLYSLVSNGHEQAPPKESVAQAAPRRFSTARLSARSDPSRVASGRIRTRSANRYDDGQQR
jgi:cytochrome d ubiquinol oxidase subunit I